MVGQEHVTDPLSTALDTGRISHAYLFSGPRGCGKTSSARILARSLNCAQGPTSTPCGVCPSCVALGPGGPGNIDVIELDAASHGGVDDTRELRDRAFYAPAESRYRVFIVDEAHMVTTAGFNALLKIVEEPPAHLIFIFATTEPDKVLPTIRSRTHHYPFRLLPPVTMRGLLGRICEQESVQVEEAVYPLVIRAGGGSPRDSLSVLDQLLAGAGSEGVTYSRAVSLLGVTDVALIDDAVAALADDDGAALFGTVDQVMEAGHDPRRFAVDLLERFRDLILLRAVPDAIERGLVSGPGDVLDRMRDQADRIGPATLTRYAELLHAGLGEMRGATAPRLLLEVVCARMLLPSVSDGESAALQRLERLERGMATGAPIAAAPAAAGAPVTAGPGAAEPVRRRGAEVLAAMRDKRGGAAKTDDRGDAEAAPSVARESGGAASGRESGIAEFTSEAGHAAREPQGGPAPTAAVGPGGAGDAANRRTTDSAPDRSVDSGGGSGDPGSASHAAANDRAGSNRADGSPGVSGVRSAAMRDPANGDAYALGDAGVARTEVHGAAGTARQSETDDRSPVSGSDRPPVSGSDRSAVSGSDRSVASGSGGGDSAPSGAVLAGPVSAADGSDSEGRSDAELLRAVESAWGDIRSKVREFGAAVHALLSGASVSRIEGDVIVFAHQHPPLAQRLSDPRNLDAVRSAVRAVLGREHDVRWESGAAARPAPQTGGRSRGAGQQSGPVRGGQGQGGQGQGRQGQGGQGQGAQGRGAAMPAQANPRSSEPSAPPRYSRPSQANKSADSVSGARAPRSFAGEDDIPPPDYPDLPDDPGPGDYPPPDPVSDYDLPAPAAPQEPTPEEEREMFEEAARPVAPEDRRDPDEVALELLRNELGATRLDG